MQSIDINPQLNPTRWPLHFSHSERRIRFQSAMNSRSDPGWHRGLAFLAPISLQPQDYGLRFQILPTKSLVSYHTYKARLFPRCGVNPTQPLTEIDFAKVAVVIDCEGHIAINGSPQRRTYALQVTVGNKDFALPEWCKEKFGGKIYRNEKQRSPEYAPARRWRIQSREAADLLTKCLPHFIIKRPQAELAIKFQSTYGKPGERTNETDRIAREQLRLKLRALTKRGPRITTTKPTNTPEEGNLFAKLAEGEKGNREE